MIDSTLVDGSLTYGECLIPGAEQDEFLLTCHVCHPSLANDNLSGIATLARQFVDAAGGRAAQALAYSLVRPGGTLSIIAVQTAGQLAFSPIAAYDANITLRFGRAPVRSLLDRIMPLLGRGLTIPTAVVVSHPQVPLDAGIEMYRLFAARERGLVKVLFQP